MFLASSRRVSIAFVLALLLLQPLSTLAHASAVPTSAHAAPAPARAHARARGLASILPPIALDASASPTASSPSGATDPAQLPGPAGAAPDTTGYDGTAHGMRHGADFATFTTSSPDGSTIYVTGVSTTKALHTIETMALDAATGATRWTASWNSPANHGRSDDFPVGMVISSDGSRLYVAGETTDVADALTNDRDDYVALAYDTATGALAWSSIYNGAGGRDDQPASIAVDGGVVALTGLSVSTPDEQQWMDTVALDAATGATLWIDSYAGPDGTFDSPFGQSVAIAGGRVIVGGATIDGANSYDALVRALDATTGAPEWTYLFDGGVQGLDTIVNVSATPTRVVAVGGTENDSAFFGGQDSLVTGLDAASGNPLWTQRTSREPQDVATNVVLSADGARAFTTGTTLRPHGDRNLTLDAYDIATGTHAWSRSIRDSADTIGFGLDARGGRVAVAATLRPSENTLTAATIVVDATSGADVANIPDTASSPALGLGVALSPDGAHATLIGANYSVDSHYDMRVVDLDLGTKTPSWTASFNGEGDSKDLAKAEALSPDGSTLYVTGTTGWVEGGLGAFRMYIAAYDASTLAERWSTTWRSDDRVNDLGLAIAVTPDGSRLLVAGQSFHKPFVTFEAVTLAVDASTGAIQWTRLDGSSGVTERPTQIALSPDGATAYVASSTFVRAIAVRDGALRMTLPSAINAAIATTKDGRIVVARSALPTGTSALTQTTLDENVTLYTTTGAIVWSKEISAPQNSATADNDDLLVDGLALDPSGTRVFTIATTDYVPMRGSIQDWFTAGFDLANGATSWTAIYNSTMPGTVSIDAPIALAAGPDGASLFVTGRTSQPTIASILTIAYDAASGAERWRSRHDNGMSEPSRCTPGARCSLDLPVGLMVGPEAKRVYVAATSYVFPAASGDIVLLGLDAADGSEASDTRWNASVGDVLGDAETSAALLTSDGTRVLLAGLAAEMPDALYEVATDAIVQSFSVAQAPTVTLDAQILQAHVPAQVRLSASATSASGIADWSLDPGDGSAIQHGTGAPPATIDITYARTGSFQPTLRVHDANGTAAARAVTIAIAPDRAPSIDPVAPQSVAQTSALAFTLSGSDPDGDATAWSLARGPSGLAFDPATRTATWTPSFAQYGAYNATFDASDGTLSSSVVVPIQVTLTPRAPTIAGGSASALVGQPLVAFVRSSSPNHDNAALTATDVPAGASFTDLGNGTGKITWTPEPATEGEHDITVTATSAGLSASATYAIVVLQNASFTLATDGPAPDPASPGDTIVLSAMIQNTGVESDTFRFALTGAAGWSPTTPPDLTLGPGQSTLVTVTLVAPADHPSALPKLTATSLADARVAHAATWSVSVPIVLRVEIDPADATRDITGRAIVTWTNGAPIAHANVTLVSTPELPAGGSSVASHASGTTGAGGAFAFDLSDPQARAPLQHAVSAVATYAGRSASATSSYTPDA